MGNMDIVYCILLLRAITVTLIAIIKYIMKRISRICIYYSSIEKKNGVSQNSFEVGIR